MPYARKSNYSSRKEGLILFEVTDEAIFDCGWNFQVFNIRGRNYLWAISSRPSEH